jgi:glutamine synthetase
VGGTRTGDEVVTAVARLRSEGIRFVRVLHSDPYGRARSKELPIESLVDVIGGLGYCEASLVEGLDGQPLMGDEFPGGQGFPDIHAIPDLTTSRTAPWQRDTAWMLADLRGPEGASPLCCRGVLARQVELLAVRGLHAVVASEPEFYLLRETADGTVAKYSPGTGMAYTTGVRADPEGVLRQIHDALDRFDVGVTTANREYSPGQFEINLSHTEALAAADRAFLLEEVVKDVAARNGLLATFMAKPFTEHEGSSHHVHVSLWRGDANAFATADGGLSDLATAFAGGVLAHARGLTALASPTVNSYKRLAATEGLVPAGAGLGGDNRLSYLRIPSERGRATRVEVRGADASANPYLLIAAILAAGLDGIEREIDPVGLGTSALPVSLGEALAALEQDEVLTSALGERLVAVHAALKRRECARYAATVTDWEWREYAHHA